MRFRIFYIIALFCSVHVAFSMEQQSKPTFFDRVRQHVYSAGQLATKCALVAKNAALAGIHWAWKKRANLVSEIGAEYFFPTEANMQRKTWKERIWDGLGILWGYDICGTNQATYVKYRDSLGAKQRCYAEEDPDRFEELTAYEREDPLNLNPRLVQHPVRFDNKLYYRTIAEEACLDLLLFAAKKVLFNKVKVAHNSTPSFYKRVAGRLGNIVLHDVIIHTFIRPCIKFGARVGQQGFYNAFQSLWHNNQSNAVEVSAV